MGNNSKALNRFVLRARRVGAHSLARDRKHLTALSTLTLTGRIGLDGKMEMRRSLPEEEVFESLAARVRPLLVLSESVHYEKVLTAIQDGIDATESDIPENLLRLLYHLRHQWSQLNVDSSDILRFAIQATRADGSESTPQVSDTQMAAAWLYGDLVHVDTRGPKDDGLLFPIKERYSAAVTYFAHAAVLTLRTLDLVIGLHELNVLELSDDALAKDVVVGREELVEEGFAYIASTDTPMPSLGDAIRETPEGFRPLTATELLRQTQANQVQVVLYAADGSMVGEYEAAVSGREERGGRMHWEALVAGAVTFEVSFRVEDGKLGDGRFEGMGFHATTNRMKLAEALLEWEMSRSRKIGFVIGEQTFFSLDVDIISSEEVAALEVSLDTLYDLVSIENITQSRLVTLAGNYTVGDRALLRRTRLLWEGQVVPFRSQPLMVTTPTGKVPAVIIAPAAKLTIGDTDYPSPTTYIRHPGMTQDPESVTPVPNSDPPAEEILMTAPSGQPFLAWAPERRQIHGDDDLANPAPWDLAHFDEQAFLRKV